MILKGKEFLEDYIDHFNDLLNESIYNRIRHASKIGITLSGGLDSATVAVKTKELLMNGQKIYAYTSVPRYNTWNLEGKNNMGDESYHARLIARKCGIVDHRLVCPTDAEFFKAYSEMLNIHYQPLRSINNYYWIFDILKRAKSDKIDTLLIAQFGNGTISFPNKGNIKHFRFGHIWHMIFQNPFLFSKIMAFKARAILDSEVKKNKGIFQEINFLSKNLFDKYYNDESIFNNRLMRISVKMNELRASIVGFDGHKDGATWSDLADFFKIQILDPTSDKEIVEFCFSIPDKLLLNNGKGRGMIFKALKNELPDEVLTNPLLGLQSADLGWRLYYSQKSILTLINQMKNSELVNEYIDTTKLESVFNKVVEDTNRKHDRRYIYSLSHGILIGKFLIELEQKKFSCVI